MIIRYNGLKWNPKVMVGIFLCAGQVCSATSRLLVQDTVQAELLDILCERTRAIKIGDPLLPSTLLGPVATPPPSPYLLIKLEANLTPLSAESGLLVAAKRRSWETNLRTVSVDYTRSQP